VARRKLNQIDGQFSARTIEMLESPAWRALTLSAHRVFDRVCIELAHHGGNDNGKLPVTFDQFVEYGLDRHAIAPAIRECEALGFLKVTQRGRHSAGDIRWPNLFLLTCVNCKSTPSPSHEWRRIADAKTAKRLAKEARAPRRILSQPAKEKQKPSVETPHCDSGGNQHCEAHSPVGETHTTVLMGETHTTSISPVGSEAIR
jgi:hypothetical protein